MVEETQLNADGEEQKPAPRRRTRRTTAKAEPENAAAAQGANPEEDAPKPATRRRRTRATAESEAADQAPPSEAPEAATTAEEAPKPRRTRRRVAAETSEEAAPTAAEPVAEEEAPKPRRATRRRTTAKAQEAEPVAEQAPPTPEEEAPKPRRTRRRATAEAEPDAEPGEPVAEAPAPAPDEEAPKPARRRRTRRSTAEAAEGDASGSESPVSESQAAADPDAEPGSDGQADTETTGTGRRRRRSRRGGAGRRRQTAEGAVAGIPPAPEPSALEEPTDFQKPKGRRRKKSEPTPDETVDVSFMHPSEREFAHLLDYYQIPYLYEPRSFPLRWDGDRVVEMFTPDFYLPEYDQYFELTTMKQSLVTQKNRKLRHVREVYPEINVQLLYRRDLMRLMGKYGYGPLSEVSVEGTERVLYSEEEVQSRVRELGQQLTREYAGKDLVLIGVLRGVVVFMADLMREIDLPLQIEFMEISHYGEEREEAIDIIRDLSTSIEGRHVIVVEDIVDTGLTLRFLLEHLKAKKPASVKICAMLDKAARRMAKLPIDYVGFEIPDEFVIGYGLDYGGRYRNLKHIGVLKPIEPKAVPQR